jgi:hypothetical protein
MSMPNAWTDRELSVIVEDTAGNVAVLRTGCDDSGATRDEVVVALMAANNAVVDR